MITTTLDDMIRQVEAGSHHRTALALLAYVVGMLGVISWRPGAVFDDAGRPRPFGTGCGDGKTILALGVVTVIVAVAAMSIVCMIDIFRAMTSNPRSGT